MKPTIFFLIICIFTVNNLYSQDTIVKTNREKIICKIKEIGTDEIKYQISGETLIFGVDKNKVAEVVLASGLTMKFNNSLDDAENYKDNNKNSLKFTLLSPLWGYTGITYEHSIKPGLSFECTLGIIGLGRNVNSLDYVNTGIGNNAGAAFRFGLKFIKTPDFYLKGIQYAHVLKGLYFKPELLISYFNVPSYVNTYTIGNSTNSFFSGAILFNLGYQWIFNNKIAVDIFGGVGYGYNSSGDGSPQYYGYGIGSSNFPIAYTTGFRIGFLFK